MNTLSFGCEELTACEMSEVNGGEDGFWATMGKLFVTGLLGGFVIGALT